MGSYASPKTFALKFSCASDWSVSTNFLSLINRCKWEVRPLSRVSKLRNEIAIEEEIKSSAILLLDRISFEDGKIHAGSRISTKMKQFKSYKGDIVVSKINARKGAIGIVESDKPIGVTVHFRVLIPDEDVVNRLFLWLALRGKFCRNQFEIATGGQGKGEISEERLMDINVPFPPLPIQETIVEKWLRANQAVSLLDKEKKSIVENLNSILQQMTKGYFELKNSRFIIADFSKSTQWDVKSGRSAVFRSLNPDFVRLGDFSKECSEKINPWEYPEKDWPIYGVNNDEGVFFNCYQKGEEFNAAYKKIQKNWFFHNPTRANVGSLGIVPDVPDDAITSPEYQVWKLNGGYLPEFMALVLKTDYFLTLVEFNRVGGVKQRMYYANLAEIRLPLLDMNIQMQFADEWKNILLELRKTEQKQIKSHVEIEEMILGIRPVERI